VGVGGVCAREARGGALCVDARGRAVSSPKLTRVTWPPVVCMPKRVLIVGTGRAGMPRVLGGEMDCAYSVRCSAMGNQIAHCSIIQLSSDR
jgi:hypothetical protein